MVSCGVSQEEEAANEKRKTDSLAALEAAVNAAKAAARVEAAMDSVIQVQVTDSVNSANWLLEKLNQKGLRKQALFYWKSKMF